MLLFASGLVLAGCADVDASPPAGSTPSTSSTTPQPPTGSVTPTVEPTTAPTATPTRATSTATPSTKPSAQPSPKPSPKPTAKPTKSAEAAAKAKALQVERKLEAFGYPVGTVDGKITRRARQALCAWRETVGLPINRGPLTQRDINSVLGASAKPVATRASGLYVNKTCQVLFQISGKSYKRIVWVSSGSAGYDTPNGTGKVWRKWAGKHESSLYEEAFMYDSIYIFKNRPGIALHGSRTNSLVHSYPASHGCVRVWRPDIHRIFDETPIGTRVTVYGKA
ncbi:L,D-transpeptidase [Kribbella deserti]|uniref:L,D-transpeptidase n=1 Tax=Kribbella deserti TaxID=1926257 RepID=A0ABV6QP27_9ACTN